jgi:DNA-binding MarR family transcriptional regulator
MKPLFNSFALITKFYLGVLRENLMELPVDRYYHIIMEVGEHKGKMNLRNLADLFQVDKVIITRNIHYLAEKKILIKKGNSTDRRSYNIELTERGKSYYKRIKEVYRAIDTTCLKKIRDNNRNNFIKNLNEVKNTLQFSQKKKTKLTFKSAGKS